MSPYAAVHMIEYRFDCVDAAGVRQTLRHAALSNDDLARTHAQHMLCEFPSILIYEDERLVARVARSPRPAGP